MAKKLGELIERFELDHHMFQALDDRHIVFNQLMPQVERAPQGSGFEFHSFVLESGPMGVSLFGKDNEYDVFAHGVAYYDGLRHLYFGHEFTDNSGYLFWPDLVAMRLLIDWLEAKVHDYCGLAEKPDEAP